MARNKLIYALADAALVMSSAKDSGGTLPAKDWFARSPNQSAI